MSFLRNRIISRRTTGLIHYFLDNWLPPIIRDSRWFMLPFFRLAYKTKEVDNYMNFKSNIYTLTPPQLQVYYENFSSIGTERATDLNNKSIKHIFSHIKPEVSSLLDVGCGKGYFACLAAEKGFNVVAMDIVKHTDKSKITFVEGNIERLPFSDKSHDVVTCHHTLEHVLNIKQAVSELKRVAKKQIIVTVPCQRFFYYTLDLHLHFFPKKEILINLMGLPDYSISKIHGDWVYVANL